MYIISLFLVKTLETLISEIKSRGFEKCKNEIDEKLKIKKYYEVSIESLQKKINFINSQKKHHGTKNTKIIGEANLCKDISQVI